MLNYRNLNDVEFEYLCQDIMQRKLNTVLHKFARGKDGGIDLADNVHTKNIIVQVKHYMRSSADQLIISLKNEVAKVKKLSPQQYYICCSKELSPQKVEEIYNLFSDYMDSPSNIITLNEIDDFLTAPANIEILKKHFKLWIESTEILQDIGNTNIFIDCESLLANIKNEENLFVKTSAFTNALKCLEDNKTLFITGNPGVGKTIISKMLILYYAAIGYRVRFSTNVSDLDELKKSLSRNPEMKEIILVDDCFGQAYFKMKESQNAEILSLINYVNSSANKLLILNSRITILKEAKEQKPELVKCFEGKQCKVYILDMTAMDNVEKAKIFYNHIVFNGMDNAYFSEIQKDKRYFNIIKHPNYTPRIIEFICNINRYKDVEPSQYYEFVMQQLDNPREIWKDEYERKLQKVDRILLLTLYSLSDSTVDESTVKECFEHRIAYEPDIDTTINQYEASLTRLMDGFIQLVYEHGTKKLAMINPSVNDYLDGRLNSSVLEKQQLIDNSFSIQQKKRLLSEGEFESFALAAISNHEIEKCLFSGEWQKNAFISYYVSKYKVFDHMYTSYIQDYLAFPRPLHIYGNTSILPVEIFRLLFSNDICDFYKIGDYITSTGILDQMLNVFDLDAMVETVLLVNRFFNGDNRNAFIEIVSDQLRYAVEEYCGNIDADEFDVDVDHAIEMSRYADEHYEGVDISRAVSYLEDDIISDVEDEIEMKLASLPMDIESHRDYTDRLTFSIYGVKDLVNSHLEYDGYDYDDYREQYGNYDNADSEIDYIFNRK